MLHHGCLVQLLFVVQRGRSFSYERKAFQAGRAVIHGGCARLGSENAFWIVFWEGNAILHQFSPSMFVDILLIIYLSIDQSIYLSTYVYIYIIKIYIYIYSFIYLQLCIYIFNLVVSSIFNYIAFFQGFSNPGESKPLLVHPKTPSTWILVQRRLPWKISNGPCTPMHWWLLGVYGDGTWVVMAVGYGSKVGYNTGCLYYKDRYCRI